MFRRPVQNFSKGGIIPRPKCSSLMPLSVTFRNHHSFHSFPYNTINICKCGPDGWNDIRPYDTQPLIISLSKAR